MCHHYRFPCGLVHPAEMIPRSMFSHRGKLPRHLMRCTVVELSSSAALAHAHNFMALHTQCSAMQALRHHPISGVRQSSAMRNVPQQAVQVSRGADICHRQCPSLHLPAAHQCRAVSSSNRPAGTAVHAGRVPHGNHGASGAGNTRPTRTVGGTRMKAERPTSRSASHLHEGK